MSNAKPSHSIEWWIYKNMRWFSIASNVMPDLATPNRSFDQAFLTKLILTIAAAVPGKVV